MVRGVFGTPVIIYFYSGYLTLPTWSKVSWIPPVTLFYSVTQRTYSLSFCLQDNGLSKSSTISSSTAEAMRQYMIISDMKTILHQLRDVLMIYSIKFQTTLRCTRQFNESEGHVAAARKRSHQWCLTLTPSNTETIERMTCHCFLRPIRSDLTSSSYIHNWNLRSA